LILQHRLKLKPDCPAIEVIKKYGNLPRVECYAAQLNQVFMNLLGNAIDAIETKCKENYSATNNTKVYSPQIVIHTQLLQQEKILVCINDNGYGVSQEVRPRVFDPFFTTKELGKGTGLGLSISYQIIVEKHGGKIECFSEPGRGAEFLIEIPIKHSGVGSRE
jgi:signal transduction histidine kinase